MGRGGARPWLGRRPKGVLSNHAPRGARTNKEAGVLFSKTPHPGPEAGKIGERPQAQVRQMAHAVPAPLFGDFARVFLIDVRVRCGR